MSPSLNPDLVYRCYRELRAQLPVVPPRYEAARVNETVCACPDLATVAFAMPLAWVVTAGEELTCVANFGRVAIKLAHEAPRDVLEHLYDYSRMVGMLLAEDVAETMAQGGEALREEVDRQYLSHPRAVSAGDRARVHQAALAAGMDTYDFQRAVMRRNVH